jgi:7,8-dihydropterin-6-yl-methyl-4-(beta-D-ribofuranosyl)aminobenzene 5'-phosphate synthase
MKLTIVYDNKIYRDNPGIPDHGFSCYIEADKKTILFDTGTNGKILLNNMNLLSLKPKNIDIIVISHEHYDHNGGLPSLIPHLNNPTIFRLEPSDTKTKIKEILVNEPVQISKHVSSTGRLKGSPIDEQSLLLDTKEGIVVLTGCSHPCLDSILKVAETKGDVIGLIGGFHGFSDFSLLKSLHVIYPCHCTKFKNEIIKKYPITAFDCGVGLTIKI